MGFPTQPKWVIDEALSLHQAGSTYAEIARILAAKGVVSGKTGSSCTENMVNTWVIKARAMKGLPARKKSSPADVAVTLAPPEPEDGDLALLRTILDSRSYDKPKKMKMFKNLISAMDA